MAVRFTAVCAAMLLLVGCQQGMPGRQEAAPDPNAPLHEAAYPGKIKVACVGDSITNGSGTSAPRGQSNGYPAQLQRMLGDKYDVRNFGVGGTTLLNSGDKPYQRQAAFGQSKEFQADVVVIMLGTNDSKRQNWAHKDQFVADYQNLVSQYASAAHKPRIFVCLPCFVPGQGNAGINEPSVLEEMPLIRQVAGEMGLGVIDIHGATLGKDALFPDRIHPNNAGAAILAATVYRTLKGTAYAGPSVIATQ